MKRNAHARDAREMMRLRRRHPQNPQKNPHEVVVVVVADVRGR